MLLHLITVSNMKRCSSNNTYIISIIILLTTCDLLVISTVYLCVMCEMQRLLISSKPGTYIVSRRPTRILKFLIIASKSVLVGKRLLTSNDVRSPLVPQTDCCRFQYKRNDWDLPCEKTAMASVGIVPPPSQGNTLSYVEEHTALQSLGSSAPKNPCFPQQIFLILQDRWVFWICSDTMLMKIEN